MPKNIKAKKIAKKKLSESYKLRVEAIKRLKKVKKEKALPTLSDTIVYLESFYQIYKDNVDNALRY